MLGLGVKERRGFHPGTGYVELGSGTGVGPGSAGGRHSLEGALHWRAVSTPGAGTVAGSRDRAWRRLSGGAAGPAASSVLSFIGAPVCPAWQCSSLPRPPRLSPTLRQG